MNMPADLQSLKAMWITYKEIEEEAKKDRVAVEDAILAQFPSDKLEGSVTNLNAGITVSYKLTRSVNTEAVQEAWEKLSPNARKAFKWTAGLDLKAYRACQDMDPDSFAQVAEFVTSKPAKPAISVKE